MSKFTDELRDISAWHSIYDEEALSGTVRLAADILDEAERALADIAHAPMDPQAHIRARTTLARIRGEQP